MFMLRICCAFGRRLPIGRPVTFNLLGETDPLRVSESLGLLIDIANVQNFTHELNYRLSFVEGRGGH